MRKLVVLGVLLSILCAWPTAAKADNWGVGVKLGIGENDPKSMNEIFDQWGGKLTTSDGLFAVEVLHEWNLNETDKIGLKLGVDAYGENKYEYAVLEATENTYAIPLSVYYKKDNGVRKLSYFIGAGVTYINSEIKFSGTYFDNVEEDKFFPHILGGVEYRFTELFALGLDLKYNFSAKMEKEGDVVSDRSGFSSAVAGRFYF